MAKLNQADIDYIKSAAKIELEIEDQREAIDLAKEKLKKRKTWRRFFPWKITIENTLSDSYQTGGIIKGSK